MSANLERCLFERNRQQGRGGDFFLGGCANLGRATWQEPVRDDLEQVSLFVAGDFGGASEHHNRSVIHARVEGAASHHHAGQLGDGHAHWRTIGQGTHKPGTTRTVQQNAVAVAGVAIRKHKGLAIENQTEMTEDVRVKHLVHGCSIGDRSIAHAARLGAFGVAKRFFTHREANARAGRRLVCG